MHKALFFLCYRDLGYQVYSKQIENNFPWSVFLSFEPFTPVISMVDKSTDHKIFFSICFLT